LVRSVLPGLDVPKPYVDLFCEFFSIIEDIGSLTWNSESLSRFERRIIEASVWRDIMFPLPFSTRGVHHTLLHLVQCIRRHGPAPCWWNYSSERYGGALKRMLHSYKSIEVGILLSHAVRYEATLREATLEGETELRREFLDRFGRSTNPDNHKLLRKGSSTANLADIQTPSSLTRMTMDDKRANTFFPAAVFFKKSSAPSANSNLAINHNNTHSVLTHLIRFITSDSSPLLTDYPKLVKELLKFCTTRNVCVGTTSKLTMLSLWMNLPGRGKRLVKTPQEEIFFSGFNPSVETFKRVIIHGVLYRTRQVEDALLSQSSGGRVRNDRRKPTDPLWSYCIIEKIIRWRIFKHEESPAITVLGVSWLTVKYICKDTGFPVTFLDPTSEDNKRDRLIFPESLEPVNIQRIHISGEVGTKSELFKLVTLPRSIKHKDI
jgi:hypothetical protein